MQTQTRIAQTRGIDPNDTNCNRDDISFIDALLNPKASYNGLYTLEGITPIPNINSLRNLSYQELSIAIFKHLNIESSLIDHALKTYDKFEEIAPLKKISNHLYALELYHGPTSSFKDMALAPFGDLLDSMAGKNNEKYLILAATSGDTGPAALNALRNAHNIKAICMYPSGGTSKIQELQLSTIDSKNLNVFKMEGDFDTAQSTLKLLLNDPDFRKQVEAKGYKLSVANSVNIVRIAFQIVYYIWASFRFESFNENGMFNVFVPSGNFGNALGAFFAKKLGAHISTINISTNPNDVLDHFFKTGIYDIRNKHLILTCSPAMDILKSSNIERLLYAYFGTARTKELYEHFDKNNFFKLTKDELKELQATFKSKSISQAECLEGIKDAYSKNYILDPHTSNAYMHAISSTCPLPSVIVSTAHWSKFPETMLKALLDKDANDETALLEVSLKTKSEIPNAIKSLFNKKVVHTEIYRSGDIKDEILKWL
ncbi:threonine synthase [Helicobacter sp. 11S02629-2]|uniref:threonine synthase n=1 Tax=Helicobacter sp. 11S02629-2 TaxID=1476195 RepID=UPI000BA581B5|nr:threonine synthase [Helicobacter sp. 11S02629-2]PAF43660.1 threonine synthase [Helicobacter sp. 11S02629-2]